MEAQPFASYETVHVVTKSGAIRPKRVAQNLLPEAPLVQEEPATEVEQDAEDAEDPPAGNEPMADDSRDDVLGGREFPKNGRLRKVRTKSRCRPR